VHYALSTNCSPKVPGSDRCGIPYLNKTSCRVRPGSALWYLRANLYLSAVLYTTTKTTSMTTKVTQQRLTTLQFFGLLPCKYELGLRSHWQSAAPTTHTVHILHPFTGKPSCIYIKHLYLHSKSSSSSSSFSSSLVPLSKKYERPHSYFFHPSYPALLVSK